ncbi:MAG TPA: cyclopropane-fatty-acyl-phospholipid synthase family protein [Gemmatimonadaceae bacterium]|jgi:cyclopropane-fatty-acyl-phospholipid synthase|nr:cyclopropane-fatty-acyl-phospholipid synthase family protein [Gemmatimonadaceae bacterium]
MSHQHSFDLDDRRQENGDNRMTGEIVTAVTADLQQTHVMRDSGAFATSDPRVPLSQEVVEAVFGPQSERRFAVRYWDGTFEPAGATSSPDFTLGFERPGALRRMLLPATELSIAESFISGDVEIEGNMELAMYLADSIGSRMQSAETVARLLRKLVALPKDPAIAPKEVKGSRFSRGVARVLALGRPGDEKAIQYHYDVGNDFYQLWLDPKMVYTCAYFKNATDDLATAQVAKLDHICRKLRLEPGMKFLDVGCGWGALIMHAAENYGVDAVGITLSQAQADLGRQRIAQAGLSDRCRIELRDYRDLGNKMEFDRAASVGMMEHVREDLQPGYFECVYRVLKPGGLFMNHAIVSVARARPSTLESRMKAILWRRDAFIDKYVFPDGKLVPIAHVIASAERVGFELRDIESLREHYAMTLRHWTKGLETHSTDAIRIAGERIYRVWRLYMSSAIYGFVSGRINIIQALLVKPGKDGQSDMPLTRDYMYYPVLKIEVPDSAAA